LGQSKTIAEVFAERIANARASQMKEMTLTDQLDYKNPHALSEFSQEIFLNMKRDETSKMVPVDYLSKV